MGRDTGWLAAAGALAQMNGKSVADFIYLPERAFDIETFLKDVTDKFKEQNQVYIVVSEVIKDTKGKFISEIQADANDKFGHAQLGGVGNYLKKLIINAGITKRVKSLELGVLQRCAMHCSSEIDLKEAYEAGYEALKYSLTGKCGYMVTIERTSNEPYETSYSLIEADKVANNIKYFPTDWINDKGNHIEPQALKYLLPLISPLPEFKVFNK